MKTLELVETGSCTWNGNQSWHGQVFAQLRHPQGVNGEWPLFAALKGEVERNAYDHQSRMIGSIWTDLGWTRVVSLPMKPELSESYGVSYSNKDPEKDHTAGKLMIDAYRMIREAIAIVWSEGEYSVIEL